MKNIFLTTKDAIAALAWPKADRDEYWRFVSVLPLDDLEELGFILKRKEDPGVLLAFREKNEMWNAARFGQEDIENGFTVGNWDINKYRLAYTMYQLLGGAEYDSASAWLRVWEMLTRDTLEFSKLAKETEAKEYYHRVYTLLGWKYVFQSPPWLRDMFWQSQQLLSGLRMGVDVERIFEDFIIEFKTVRVHNETVKEVAELLEKNESFVRTSDEQPAGTVAEWLKKLLPFIDATSLRDRVPQDVPATLKKFIDAEKSGWTNVSETDQYALGCILSFYIKLRGGFYNIHPDESDFPEQVVAWYSNNKKSVSPIPVSTLRPFFSRWYKKIGADEKAREALVRGLMDRVKIEDCVEDMYEVNAWMSEAGDNVLDKDIIFFDENDGAFHWNDNLLRT